VLTERERKAFEAWVGAPPYERDLKRFAADDATLPNQYKNYETELAWCAWRERADRAKQDSSFLSEALNSGDGVYRP